MSNNVTIAFLSRSILHTHQFSWVFLVDWLMILFLSIFVLFYFNHLLGFLVSQTFCRYLWYRHGVYVKIQSIQISLVGGRIIFKNVVYIGTSQGIRIVRGSLNWHYWISNRVKSAFITREHADDSKKVALRLKVYGVEWFVYNREYAYEVLAKQESPTARIVLDIDSLPQGLGYFERKLADLLPLNIRVRNLGIVFGNDDTESLIVLSSPDVNCMMDMAPSSNKYDRFMKFIDASFQHPQAELQDNPDYQVSSITPDRQYRKNKFSRNRRHKWMQRLKVKSEKEPERPWLGLKRYMDDSENQEASNNRNQTNTSGRQPSDRPSPVYPEDTENEASSTSSRIYHTETKRNKDGASRKQADEMEEANNKHSEDGIFEDEKEPRNPFDNNTSEDAGNNSQSPPTKSNFLSHLAALPVEYAKVSQLLACDVLKLKFYMDVPGKANTDSESASKDSNGHETESEATEAETDPRFDTELKFFNAKINYGPYAERQRQSFFSFFFPRNCTDAIPPDTTSTGTPCIDGMRAHPFGNVNIEFLGESALVIPVREISKDEEFKASFLRSLQSFQGEIQRTYGWLEIRVGSGSSIDLKIPCFADINGYQTRCEVSLRRPDVRSSVNHDTMFCAQHHNIVITLHQPRVWNALQTYKIQNTSTELDFYALREHVTLISDTLTDFSTGSPVSYALFTPFKYEVEWDVTKHSLYLNVNKGNIINKPTNLSENTFLILRAPELHIKWDVPREFITTPYTTVNTVLEAPLVELELSAPNWHTLHGFLDWQRMARVDKFKIELQHHFTTLTLPHREGDTQLESNPSRFVDTQILDVSGEQFAMTAHGFLIDYIMRVRENYFGHAYHFQTTEEFLQKHMATDQKEQFESSRPDVDADTQMRIRVDKGCFLWPTRLYSCKDCVSFQFVELNADCRFTNYYMDLQVEITPVTGRLLHGLNPGTAHEEALRASFSNADLSISQIEVRAHRMFGLPPVEPTYVVRWDFDIGDITADFLPDFATATREAALAFGHSFHDDENKPVLAPEELHDVTFLSVNVASIDAVVRPSSTKISNSNNREHGARFQIATSSIRLREDDLSNERYSAHRTLDIPFVGVRGYAEENQLAFEAQTAVHITGFMNKQHSKDFYQKQQNHLALHDALFHRASFLLDNDHRWTSPLGNDTQNETLHPCIPLRSFDPPLTRENLKILDPQFAAVDERRGSTDSSQNTSLESIVSDSHNEETSDDNADVYGDMFTVPQYVKSEQARSAKPSPDVFPFSGSTISPQRERLRSKKASFGLHPSQWHPNAPQLLVDDEVENLSIVVQIMPVKISFTPKLVALVEAFDKEPVVDFEAQLDALQINIVRGLVQQNRIEEVVRAHIITPIITVDFSERLQSNDGIRLEIQDVDAMLKFAGKTRGANVVFDSLSVSLRHRSQSINDVTRINAVTLVLSKFSFLWQETSQEDGTGSLKLDSIDLSVAADNIDWAIKYIGQLIHALPRQVRRNSDLQAGGSLSMPDNNRKTSPKSRISRQESLKATFFALTMAGERMGVEQDSYVLSRPSGAVQSQSHVRTKTSWRLIMRLRYLLQRLPPSEKLRIQKEITEGTFKLPDDAKEQAIDIYKRWRSWEQSRNLFDTEIFKLVFDDKTFQEYVLSLSTRLFVGIQSMVARIVYPDMHDHFAGLDSLRMQLVSTQKNETQNLNLAFRCSKVRARGSIELVTVAATIIAALALLEEEQRHEKQEAETAVNENDEANEVPKQKSSDTSRALQASISVFVLDLILEFDLVTLRVETQNHQIQFTSAVELMESAQLESLFHTGTLVTSDGAFRIHQQHHGPQQTDKMDVLDTLVEGVQMGYASRGPGSQSNTWATMNVNTVSCITHPTLLELSNIFVKFLEEDMPVILSAAEKLHESVPKHIMNPASKQSSAPPSISSDSKRVSWTDSNDDKQSNRRQSNAASASSFHSGSLLAGQYVNINIASFKFRARLVEDLRFMFQGKDLHTKLRHTDALVSSLDLNRCTVGVHFGDGSAAVANTQLEAVRTVFRYDPELVAIAIFNNASAIRLETMSLVWILEYAKHKHIDAQVKEVAENLNKAFKVLNESELSRKEGQTRSDNHIEISSGDTNGESTQQSPSKMKLRLVNRVREISIRLPLDTSSFKLTIANAHLHFENFQTFKELENLISGPETMGVGLDDLKVELLTSRKPVREMVRMKFNGSILKEQEKTYINVKSDYMLFALDPEAVGAVFSAVEKLKENSRDLFPQENVNKTSSVVDETLHPIHSNGGQTSPGRRFNGISDFENVLVTLVLQYLTITWYTSPDSVEGVVLGFDKLHVRVTKLTSHAELAGAYVTPVSTSELPIKDRMNTAYLPLIQSDGFVSKNETDNEFWIQGSINGKSIVLTITPTVALWVMALVDSFTQTCETIKHLALLRNKKYNSEESAPSQKLNNSSVESDNDWQLKQLPCNIRVNTHFDRGVFRLMEERSKTNEAALELYSPTLDVALEFSDNQLVLRVDASHTSNQIFPKAVSELKAMTTIIGLAMKERATQRLDNDIKSTKTPPSSLPSSPKGGLPSTIQMPQLSAISESSSLFDNIEVDVRVHFGSQELYLSCLPFGKVGAMLTTEGLDVLVSAPRAVAAEPSYLSIYSLVKKTKISLQHMYSREVSANIEFAHIVILGMHQHNDTFKIAANLRQPRLDIDLSKLQDMQTFIEIWEIFGNSVSPGESDSEPQVDSLRRKYSTASRRRPSFSPNDATSNESAISDDKDSADAVPTANDKRLLDKYKRAMSSVPFAFLANLTISESMVVLGLGPAIGDARITMNRCWLVGMRSISDIHTLNAGIDSTVVNFNGRLGGVVKLDGIVTKAAVQWKESQSYPLIHTKFRIRKFGFYFSLDFHPFVAGDIVDFATVLTTQDKANASDDRVHVAVTCESVSLVLTALVLAHSLDVFLLFQRLQSQISSLPLFVPEVAKEAASVTAEKYKKREQRIINHKQSGAGKDGIRVLIDVHFGELLVHAFPTEFVDSMALKVFAQRLEVHFDRKHRLDSYETGLDVAFDECIVGLASIKGGGYNKTLTDLDYEGFLRFVSKSSLGSTIVNTPEVTILMDTWHEGRDPKVIYYTFSNEVHGSIEVGWNLGSINFIKEMIDAHKDAWYVRQKVHEASIHGSEKNSVATAQAYREAAANIEREGSLVSRDRPSILQESNDQRSAGTSLVSSDIKPDANESAIVMDETDEDEDESSDQSPRVMTLNGIKYIAKQTPVILIPQLRDLGDATPPIEWLGVNRERIPLFLQYYLTRKLAYGAEKMEIAYLEIIGRMD